MQKFRHRTAGLLGRRRWWCWMASSSHASANAGSLLLLSVVQGCQCQLLFRFCVVLIIACLPSVHDVQKLIERNAGAVLADVSSQEFPLACSPLSLRFVAVPSSATAEEGELGRLLLVFVFSLPSSAVAHHLSFCSISQCGIRYPKVYHRLLIICGTSLCIINLK